MHTKSDDRMICAQFVGDAKIVVLPSLACRHRKPRPKSSNSYGNRYKPERWWWDSFLKLRRLLMNSIAIIDWGTDDVVVLQVSAAKP